MKRKKKSDFGFMDGCVNVYNRKFYLFFFKKKSDCFIEC